MLETNDKIEQMLRAIYNYVTFTYTLRYISYFYSRLLKMYSILLVTLVNI